MTDELDIVNDLLANEKSEVKELTTEEILAIPKEDTANSTTKKDFFNLPERRPVSTVSRKICAHSEKHDSEDWPGNCLQLSKLQKEQAGLPLDSYLVVKCSGTPNSEACVYDPIHWIYGWGKTLGEASKDCLQNIMSWRKEHSDLIESLVEGWENRLKTTRHPFKAPPEIKKNASKSMKRPLVDKSTTEILKDVGL